MFLALVFGSMMMYVSDSAFNIQNDVHPSAIHPTNVTAQGHSVWINF